MFKKLRTIAIKLGLKRPPQPAQRFIPVGPVSKEYFPVEGYSLRKLYGRNKVTTTKYTWYGFFFQNLGEQAQRIANFYFISLAIIQVFTDSPVSPTTSIIPLFFVLSVTMIKQGYEDFLRLKADREINHIPIEIVTENGYLTTVKSMELEVGNIILCRNNSSFPCDMVLLSSSEPSGECFVTTASLDGETNLKKFEVSGHTNAFDTPLSLASELKGYIYCQQPVEDLYTFSGRICLKNSADDSCTKDYPLGPKNLLLRGACLRNTDYIYGCAVYTGRDTKLALNSKGKTTKFSQVEGRLNFYLFFILGFLVICVIISLILSLVLGHPNVWYIPPEKRNVWSVFQELLGFVVLYNYIIPISLYVTIEMQKFVGSLFFEWDLNLYDERINERAKANTSDLIEEMGQVEYLFTDKTGTLTENSMQFRRLATSMGVFHFENNGLFRYTDTPTSTDIDNARTPVSRDDQEDLDEISEAVQLKTITESNSQSPIVNSVQTLLLLLSLCHTVRVERSIPMELFSKSELDKLSNNDKAPRRGSSALKRASAAIAATAAFRASRRGRKVKTQDYEYQASSPDEKAFVETCRDLGIVYHGSDESGLLVITIQGEAVRYRLLDILEFDSTRKCMSVVVQFVPKEYDSSESLNSPVLILCKGAETSLLSRIDHVETPNTFAPYGDPLGDSFCGLCALDLRMDPEQVMKQVTEFATLGLRTLVMGIRLITIEKWNELKEQLDKARSIINEGRQKELATAYNEIERKLTLIGCTGIEDMLQEGVPETIKALREAGIKVWVLTGDKEETAVNISYSAGHFYPGMQEIRITNFTDSVKCGSFLKSQIERIRESKVYNPDTEFGVVIDGQSLNYALVEPIRSLLTQCCLECNTVLCCRSTPLQKAEVIRLIKESHNKRRIPITAAIGDGANDVSMILEAHIGFGIYGKEGRQAVRASDYAFGRFHFIKYALLIHGYNFYQRVSLLVLYFFYKNLLFTLPQLFYGYFCAYSQQSIYPQIYLILFNLIMTSLPIFLYGIFEIPINQCILLELPILYKCITHNRLLCNKHFIIWISLASWHAIVVFFGAYFLTQYGQANDNGLSKLSDIICFGNFIILIIFFIVNIKVLLISYYLNWIILLTWNLTICINIIIFLLCNTIMFPTTLGKQLYGTYTIMWTGDGAGLTWFSIFILVILALIPDFIIRTIEDQDWKWRLKKLREELKNKQLDIKRHTRTSIRISIISKQYDELDDIEENDEKIYEYTNPIINELHNTQINDKYNYSLENSLDLTNSQHTTNNENIYDILTLNRHNSTINHNTTYTTIHNNSSYNDDDNNNIINTSKKRKLLTNIITMPNPIHMNSSIINVPRLYENDIHTLSDNNNNNNNSDNIVTRF